MFKNGLEKLAHELKPETIKICSISWADCAMTESEGLFRQAGEFKEAFCDRVYQVTQKQLLRFD